MIQPHKMTAADAAAARTQAHLGALMGADKAADDEPSVFVFSQTEGSVPPRKGNIPQPNPMTVRFAPTVAGKFKSEFLFKVRKGCRRPRRLGRGDAAGGAPRDHREGAPPEDDARGDADVEMLRKKTRSSPAGAAEVSRTSS